MHPAHIHAGTCAELGDVVAPLSDVANPVAAGTEQVGPDTVHQVKISITTVDLSLEGIIAGADAINVHLSADDIGEYIACGDIGGLVVAENDGRMEVNFGLGELNGSGYFGTVWLGAEGDDQTDVKVILIEPDELD